MVETKILKTKEEYSIFCILVKDNYTGSITVRHAHGHEQVEWGMEHG